MTEQIAFLMQLAAYRGNTSVDSGKGSGEESSFQDMLNQKQEDVRTAQDQPADKSQPEKPAETPAAGQKPADTPETEPVEGAQLLAAAVMFQQFIPQQMQQVQPAGAVMQETVQTVPEMVQPQMASLTGVPQQVVSEQPAAIPVEHSAVSFQVQAEVPQPQVQSAPQTAQPQQPQTVQTAEPSVVLEQESASPKNQQEGLDYAGAGYEEPLFREVETVPVKVGENTAVIDTKAPDVDKQLADTVIKAELKDVGDKIEIQLKPENLGHITIELTQQDGRVGLTIYADSAKTTTLLSQHASSLAALLEARTDQPVQVQVQHQEQQQPQYDGHNQQQQQEQEQQQRPSKEEQDSFLGQLRLGLFQLETV